MHCARVSSGPPRCAPGVVHACATYHAAASARRQRIMGGGVMPFLCAALPPLYNQSLICKLLLPSHLSRLIPLALDDLCCLRCMETQTGAHGRPAGRSSSTNLRFRGVPPKPETQCKILRWDPRGPSGSSVWAVECCDCLELSRVVWLPASESRHRDRQMQVRSRSASASMSVRHDRR